MNKKILSAIAVAAAIITGYTAYHEYGGTKLSGALLANVEALAEDEEDDDDTAPPPPRYIIRDCTITKYKYDEEGRVIETKTYDTKCCEKSVSGLESCSYSEC